MPKSPGAGVATRSCTSGSAPSATSFARTPASRLATTPRLAAIWTPDPQWTLKWTQGSAFREPNAYERFYFDDTQKVNPSLKAESLDSRELAAIWRPGRDLSFEASVYSFRIRDLVEL